VAVNMPTLAEGMVQFKNNLTVGKYDVRMAEVPSSPTMRQAEFVELMEMLERGVLPLTPGIAQFILRSSDLSLKNDLLAIIEQEFANQQQTQQANQERELLAKYS